MNLTITSLNNFLPAGAELIYLTYPKKEAAMIMADFDGDDVEELAVAYNIKKTPYLSILKEHKNQWQLISTVEGKGYNLLYYKALNIRSEKCKDLVLGWQLEAERALLTIYQWNGKDLKEISEPNFYYSKMDVEDMPSHKGCDGNVEIALWTKLYGKAYSTEVYRWQNDKLVAATDVYPYYFKKVARYYKAMVKEDPYADFYWYQLSKAQFRAAQYDEALKSIDIALSLHLIYTSKEKLMNLKKLILSKIETKEINLYKAPIRTVSGKKYGYIDNTGSFAIDPIFNDVMDFQANGLAVVQTNTLYGLINTKGKFIVEPEYSYISQFSEGLSVAIKDSSFLVLDEEGKTLTSKPYNYISPYKNGRALFSQFDERKVFLYGYLDRNGKEIIPAKYINGSDFVAGKAIVQKSQEKFELIDMQGKVLNSYNYPLVGDLGEGFLSFKDSQSGKFGYIRESGKIAIPPQFSSTQAFKAGRAVVSISEDLPYNRVGLINTQGRFVINPIFNDIIILNENRVAIGKAIDKERPYYGSIYALADKDGDLLTDFKFYNISSFKDGLASVYDDKSTFFINKQGLEMTDLPIVQGSGTLSIVDSLIMATVDNQISYYSPAGKLLWEENRIIPLSKQYKVVVKKYKPNKDYLIYYPRVEGMANKAAERVVNSMLKDLSGVKPINPSIQLDYSYTGNFNISLFKNRLLVLELSGYNYPFGAAHGMPSEIYVHINLSSGEFYKLKDLFKTDSDYVKVLSDIIDNKIKNNPDYSYVFPDSYTGIKEDQPFYLDENNLYIYFQPYEIGPYAAGFPTFKIPFADIMDIIDVEGSFWKSFKE